MQRIFLDHGALGWVGLGLLGALVGCASAGPLPHGEAHTTGEHGGLIGVAYKESSAVAAAPPRLAWAPGETGWLHLAPAGSSFRAKAREAQGLAVAVEGDCDDLRVNALGDDWLVSRWIFQLGEWNEATEERPLTQGSMPFALHEGRWQSLPLHEANGLGAARGTSSTEPFWVQGEFAGRGESEMGWSAFRDGKWEPSPRRVTALAEVPARGLFSVGYTPSSPEGRVAMGGLWHGGSGPKPPAAWLSGLNEFNFNLQAVEGDLWVLASLHSDRGDRTRAVWRRWSPGGGVKSGTLGEFETGEPSPAVAFRSGQEGYAAFGTRLFAWDGVRWQSRGTFPLPVSRLVVLGPNKLWASGQEWDEGEVWARSFLVEGDAVRELSAPEPLRSVAAHARGGVWSVGSGGALYRLDGVKWEKQALPAPVFAPSQPALAREVAVGEGGQLMVIAQYPSALPSSPSRPGEPADPPAPSTMILTTSKIEETLRCHAGAVSELGGRGVRGLRSWPAPAAAGCTEPFVVVDRVPISGPSEERAVVALSELNERLARVKELSALQLSPIDGDGHGFVGVAVADVATGQRVVEALRAPAPAEPSSREVWLAAQEQLSMDVVCGRPSLPVPGLAKR